MWPAVHLLLVLCCTLAPSHAELFTLGYLTGSQRRPGDLQYGRPGLTISGAISLAVAHVQEEWARAGVPHNLTFVVAETYGEERESILQTAALWRRNVSGYIGPQESCVHEGRMAASFNLPMISYFCTHQETSDKKYFPTFARTRPPDTQVSKSLAALLLEFQWTKVVFCHLDSEEDRQTAEVAETILRTLDAANVTVLRTETWPTPYQYSYSRSPFHGLVEATYQDARIYVILGSHDEHLGLLAALEDRGLLSGGHYFVVGVQLETYDEEDPGRYLRGLLRDQADPHVAKALASYLGIAPTPPVNFRDFSGLVNEYMAEEPFKFANPVVHLGIDKVIRAEAAYLYDAIRLYARGLAAVLRAGGSALNGTAIIDAIRGAHYRSAMGYMGYLDKNGDAEGNYTLLARKLHDRHPGQFGLYPVGLFTRQRTEATNISLPTVVLSEAVLWVSGQPPVAEPPCGFRGEKCISHTGQIAGTVAGTILLVFAVISLVLYRNWKYEQELDSLLWKVDFKDIQMNEEEMATSLGTKVTRATHPLIRTSQVSLSSNPDADFRYSAIYTTIGIYKARVFAIHKVKKKSIDITRSMKKELKMMRDLRHDNLNSFVGACTDPPNICIVSEYCARGSLRDILENEDVKLDNMFVASLVGDIVRGMIYLHDSPLRVHARLKTSNCLVDSRWVLKLADFGLTEFKRGEERVDDPHAAARSIEGLLYRAPELLRQDPAPAAAPDVEPDRGGTQKGDVYSFAIILYELHSRHGPFGETILPHAEILERIKDIALQPPFRPPLDALENSFDFVRDCLTECWCEDPEDRPDFKTIRTKLRPMRKGMKPNIFDNMMAMMEKYANNLEALVDDRTDQLVEEKKKTEALLYEMLPRSVAEQLKRGNKVEAENFDCVTIYFSDIVGFTAMSAESTPLQIVDFLNDLYTCFDSTIENYDVYKVETIGDAYMVVSGLPIRNGDQHAGEVASMSLQLLEAVKQFHIRHRPDERLLLRIGLHSGPVCAGVVGLKMPRYCLFGDTVNTASRMESTGTPGHIHCSAETRALLDRLGGYDLTERGVVLMKGKGDQLTYWLTGEDPQRQHERAEQRATRKGGKGKALRPEGPAAPAPRSSLRSKHVDCSARRSPLARCSSLESPKKLRFASVDLLEFHQVSKDPLLEVIADNSPCKKKGGLLDVGGAVEHVRRTSSSCPCIEHFAMAPPAAAPSLSASHFLAVNFNNNNNNNTSSSVPALNHGKAAPALPALLSAPPSPPRQPNININIYIDPDDATSGTPLLENAV